MKRTIAANAVRATIGGERSDNQVNEPDSRNNNPERKTAGHPRKRAAQHLAISLLRCQP
jgi:hypothetical protein